MIGETATASNPVLDVSVSFGRFENDSLSWEKWSAFSPNKYLEEVEKCKTPGSVAQKKAYFEAHYKKIAARKAELLEQERLLAQSESNQRDLASSNNGCSNHEEIVGSSDENGNNGTIRDDPKEEVVVRNEYQSSAIKREEEKVVESKVISDKLSKLEEKLVDVVVKEVKVVSIKPTPEKIEALDTSIEPRLKKIEALDDSVEPRIEKMKALNNLREPRPEKIEAFDNLFEPAIKKVEALDNSIEPRSEKIEALHNSIVPQPEIEALDGSIECRHEVIEALASVESEIGFDSDIKEEKSKFDSQKESLMVVTSVNKEKTVSKSKKKPSSPNPITRTPKSSTPRTMNPRPVSASSRISVSLSVSQSSTDRAYSTPSLSRNKNSSTGESKRVASKSLHMMSLSLGHGNSNSPSSLPTNRKSLIMEKMGDKDIVKRAFKTFHNKLNQSRSYGDGSPLLKQVQNSSKRTVPKVANSMTTPIKENGGSLKTNSQNKRSVKTPPSFGMKSTDREEKIKEVSKKAEQRPSNATRTKEGNKQEAEMKKLRESFNFKATPLPSFYRVQKTSKSSLDKIPAKTETRR